MSTSPARTAHKARTAATFVYDGGCGFCARAAVALAHITGAAPPGVRGLRDDVPAPSLTIASSRDVDFPAMGVDGRLIDRHALYVIDRRNPKGPTVPPPPPFLALGHEAIGWALRDHGRTLPWRLAGAVLLHPLLRAPAAIGYRLVADNRRRVSAALDWWT